MKKIMLKSVLVKFVFVGALSQAAVVLGPNTTITFEKGKAVLTVESENKLKELVKNATQTGKIDEIKVAVWSDNPAPRENEELSKVDQNLAERRVKAIEASLKRHNVKDVDSFNMAERASWLSRMFNTENAELKSEIGRGKDAPMYKDEFQIFKNNGDSSKAVIVSILKHSSK